MEVMRQRGLCSLQASDYTGLAPFQAFSIHQYSLAGTAMDGIRSLETLQTWDRLAGGHLQTWPTSVI